MLQSLLTLPLLLTQPIVYIGIAIASLVAIRRLLLKQKPTYPFKHTHVIIKRLVFGSAKFLLLRAAPSVFQQMKLSMNNEELSVRTLVLHDAVFADLRRVW